MFSAVHLRTDIDLLRAKIMLFGPFWHLARQNLCFSESLRLFACFTLTRSSADSGVQPATDASVSAAANSGVLITGPHVVSPVHRGALSALQPLV
jgi:hypothetical protein